MKIWKIFFTILFALWLLSPSGFAAPAKACFACYTNFRAPGVDEFLSGWGETAAAAKAESLRLCNYHPATPNGTCTFQFCEQRERDSKGRCDYTLDEPAPPPALPPGPNRGECLNGGSFGMCSDGSVCGDGGSCTPGNF